MTLYGYCSIVNGYCKAPAGYRSDLDPPKRRVALCGVCGDEVCTGKECSRLIGSRTGPGGRFRVCANCQEEAARVASPTRQVVL